MDQPARHDPEQGPRVVLRLSDTPGAAELAMYEREGAVVVLEGRRSADTSLLIDAGAPNPPGELEASVVAARRDIAAGRDLLAVIEGVDPTWERSEADQLRLATLVRRTRRAVDLAGWLDPRAGTGADAGERP